MKKIYLSSLVTSLLMFSNAHAGNFYTGLDLISSANTFTVSAAIYNYTVATDIDDDSQGFKLKFGVQGSEGWRIQGYLLKETYDTPVFDATNDELVEIGVDVIKGFEITPEFSPFVQIGLGVGAMDVNAQYYTDDSISAVSFKLGAGVMYDITKEIELIAGVDFQQRRWQDIVYNSVTVEIEEASTKAYVGLNYHF